MPERNKLRHLRSVIAVTETGSVAKASDPLLRASSAVARSIRELEATLDAPLFERQPSGMAPTSFGELAYVRAKRIEAELLAARAELVPQGASPQAPVFAMLVGERHLGALARLREMGHMPSVAAALGISQPAVSAIVHQLESSLNLQLFRRSARRMVVTEVGEQLLFRIRRALSELRYLEADIAQQRGQVAGRVTFAALPSSRTQLLPRAIAELTSRHRNVQLSMVDAPFEVLFAGVQSGEIDFILTGISPEYTHRDLRVQVIGRERLVVVARSGHPLTGRRRVRVADLARYPWILRDRGAPSRELVATVFRRMNVDEPQVTVQAGDLGLLRGLLIHSDAISAVSPQHLSYEIEAGLVQVLDVDLPGSERDIGFVLRRDARPSSLCEALMQQIVKASQPSGGPGRARLWRTSGVSMPSPMKAEPTPSTLAHPADDGTPVSVKIRERVRAARKRFHANDNISDFIQPGELDALLDEVETKMQGVLDSLVIDTESDHNTSDTARRVAKLYVNEVFRGRYVKAPTITEFPNAEHLNELMIVGPLTVRSACSHHFCPVIGKVWIGVLPNEHTNVIGLSKYARLAEWVMGRPQIQEEAVVQLADLIMERTQPDGLAIVMEASHYCMAWRGVKDMDSKMINSVMRGVFLKDTALRREFLALIPRP